MEPEFTIKASLMTEAQIREIVREEIHNAQKVQIDKLLDMLAKASPLSGLDLR